MSKGAIQGPYSSEDVESHLASITDALVWGRGLSEWLPPIEWRKNVQKQGHALTENTQDDLQWKYRVKGIEYGPYLYHDFLSSLKKLSDFSRVDIQGGGSLIWKDLYSFQKVVKDLNISRRAHPRVPIMGDLKIEGLNDTYRVITISEGGLGLNCSIPLSIGQIFRGVLQSPNLFVEIHCECEIVYQGEDGYTGLRFTYLQNEAQAAIIEYVKKFQGLGSL